MQLKCLHGYFVITESYAGEVSRFMSLFTGLNLVAKDDYFTFKTLAAAPTHAIKGGLYMGAQAIDTVEGKPWEIMRANGLVYNFLTDMVVPIATITQAFTIAQAGNYFVSPGLVLPGSVKEDGKRVTDYAAWYLFDTARFKYTEVRFG